MATTMKLPQIGEEIESAVVLTVLVEPGAEVAKGDPVLELESDKATTEVPASAAGVVEKVHVKAGEEVRAGQTILTLAQESESESASASASESASASASASESESESESASASESESESESEPDADADADADPDADPAPAPGAPVAPPSVRRLARELGVHPDDIAATGPDGRLTAEDVKSHVRDLLTNRTAARPSPSAKPLPDFSAFGEVEVVPLEPLRRVIARNVATNLEIPQVTQFDRADATDLERFRQQHRNEDDAPLGLTAILVGIVTRALREFPVFNASIDLASANLVLKRYVNVGVAVDTEGGLLVPVIRNAERKGLREIAQELDELAASARDRKLARDELEGASFVITNLGGLGTTRFTPLVIPPLVGVLGIGRIDTVAVFRDGAFEPRRILPLCISYDHRAVDGADAARFCRTVAAFIEDPLRLLLGPLETA